LVFSDCPKFDRGFLILHEMDNGWIKLYRNLIDWEWWDDHNASRLLIYLLCKVNYEEKKWKGIVIKPGQIVMSWDGLSKGIGLSVQSCRTAMKKLELSNEVTRKTTNRYQLVTLVKWEKLQEIKVSPSGKSTSKLTKKQQATNKQLTTTKESKEDKESKEVVSIRGKIPKLSDVIAYAMEKGVSIQLAKDAFEYYEDMAWEDKKGEPVQNWKNKILNNWFKDRNGNLKKEKPSQSEPIPPYLKNRL
jgi:hypothetical protein